MPISSELCAYAAGFVDGEGCICFTRRKYGYYPVIQVSNTNKDVLDFLVMVFGGKVGKKSDNTDKWKAQYVWRLFGPRAVEFLRLIHPYLLVKRTQAETVFQWRELREPGKRITQSVMDELFVLDVQMKVLNARGPQDA